MKTPLLAALGLLLLASVAAVAYYVRLPSVGPAPSKTKLATPTSLLEQVRNHQQLHRVTEERVLMAPEMITLCAPARTFDEPASPHEGMYAHVFVSENAVEAMSTGKGPFPAGSIVVKAKYVDAVSSEIDLYTVMLKREPGYDPAHGDWLYAVIDGPGKMIAEQGRLTKCIDCHAGYKATDYVTRTYLP